MIGLRGPRDPWGLWGLWGAFRKQQKMHRGSIRRKLNAPRINHIARGFSLLNALPLRFHQPPKRLAFKIPLLTTHTPTKPPEGGQFMPLLT